ncbi:MAG: diacylglycerol kinase family lipid kinase [Muribaculaceae bacterium]|nr:diacylglycerol kinase family lipid kinase [Muribaculaceae bacterium]
MKKVLVAINPISGTRNKEGLAARINARLTSAGFDPEIIITEYAGHAGKLAAECAAKGYHAVIAAGGDGTVNEVGTALRSSQTALGILPLGSGNGLARHLLGNIDIDHALDIIAADHIEPADYGTANGRPFLCTFGMGFDAIVSKKFAELPTRGLATYIRSAIEEYMRFTPLRYEITSGGETVEVKAFLIAVCNASQYGNNAFIAPRASVHDGLLDIVIIHAGNPLTRALAGIELFTGRLDKNMLIETMRVRSATIRHTPGPAHLDGEPISTPESVRVMCHPGDLLMFSDPAKPAFRPLLTPIESLQKDTVFRMRELLTPKS